MGVGFPETCDCVVAMLYSSSWLAPSQLDEYSIATTQSQVSGNPTPIYQISHGPNPIVYPALQSNGTQPYQGANLGSRSTTFTDKNLRHPYAMTWNLDLQYQLRANYLLQLSYDGSASVGNPETPQYNALPPDYFVNNPNLLTAFLGNNQLDRPYGNYGPLNYLLQLSYDGSASVGNPETPQYNALPPDYFVNNPNLLTAFLGNNQLDRPYGNYGTINYRGNLSHSPYH